MKLDGEHLNHHGGGIAMGHPLAASGARITAHLVHEIKSVNQTILTSFIILFRRHGNLNNVIGSACIGGGQGIAILLQKV